MTIPLAILAFFAICLAGSGLNQVFSRFWAAWFLIGWGEFLGTQCWANMAGMPPDTSVIPILTSMVLALGGFAFGLAYIPRADCRKRRPLEENHWGGLHTLLKNKYYFDELYDLIFIRPRAGFLKL